MSASLVGSEMCIRDSSRPCGTSPGARSRPRRCGRRSRRPARHWRTWRSCLLYTSDAADDM
eukprot:8709983-Alexandrium_andersonii.AAC.1